MVTAIVLINTKREMVNETAQRLVELDEVSEVYSVTGQYDLVAIVRVRSNEDIANLITGSMLRMVGIEKTLTLIALETYSRHDLDRMFSLGMEEE